MINEDRLEEIEEVANQITGEFELIITGQKPEYLEPNQRDIDMNLVNDYVLEQIKTLEGKQ